MMPVKATTTSKALTASTDGSTYILSSRKRATLLTYDGRCVAYGKGGMPFTWASSTGQPTLRLDADPGQVYMAGGAMVSTVRPSVHRVGLT